MVSMYSLDILVGTSQDTAQKSSTFISFHSDMNLVMISCNTGNINAVVVLVSEWTMTTL